MAGEARKMWNTFITASENTHLLRRYAKSVKEPAPLFDSIGEDLGSSEQQVREQAYWALVLAMPELTSILHERETRQPGWRDVEGKDQKMINRGTDIVSDLHGKLIEGHRFKIRGEDGKDPRPLVNRIVRNWQKDEQRKHSREVLLDIDAALTIPSPAGSVEDTVQEKIAYEKRKRELLAWDFYRSEEERVLFRTVYVDATPLEEAQQRLGIPSIPALRQRLSRGNRRIVAVRDTLLTYFLILKPHFTMEGKIPLSSEEPERAEKWAELVKLSVQPGVWLNGVAADGRNKVAVRPLTTSFAYAPAHLYLLAVHKDYRLVGLSHNDWYVFYRSIRDAQRYDNFRPAYDLPYSGYLGIFDILNPCDLAYLGKLIGGTNCIASSLDAYPTELPGLNDTLVDVDDSYNIWLLSNNYLAKNSYMGYEFLRSQYVVAPHGDIYRL